MISYNNKEYWLGYANQIKTQALQGLNYSRKIIKCIESGGHFPSQVLHPGLLEIRCSECGVMLDSYTGLISQPQANQFFWNYINTNG